MKMGIAASPLIQKYFEGLNKEVLACYAITEKARAKGFDPEETVPIPLAQNMAERVVGLISVVAPQITQTNVTQRILELEKQYGLLDWRVGFTVAEEIARQQHCPFATHLEAMEVGIRVGFAYLTLGIVSAPLEGFIGLKLKKRNDGKEYFALQYAGPIRGAGGTAASISVILSDYVRVKMGYAPYDPTEAEVKRYVAEVADYHERVTNLQYLPSEEEIAFMVSHLPVQVDGDPTEKIEVSNHKDLPRIETNLIRGGMALVLAEGLCQKSPKLWKRLSKWGKEVGLEWDWLKDFIALKEKVHAAHGAKSSTAESGEQKVKANNTFIMDLVAGRPIITHPLAEGGLRLRYGRTRTTGFSAAGLHPATLVVLDKYIAIGTQLKVERPGKAASVTVCEVLEGPIVKLKDGSVLALRTEEEAKKWNNEVEDIIYLGDILFNYGDFSENGQKLCPAGYCPEWWALELEKAMNEKFPNLSSEERAAEIGFEWQRLEQIRQDYFFSYPTLAEAMQLSEKVSLALHPDYTFYWKVLSRNEFIDLVAWFLEAKIKKDETGIIKIILPLFSAVDSHHRGKKVLEHAGIPHKVINKENVVIEKKEAQAFCVCFGIEDQEGIEKIMGLFPTLSGKDGLDMLNQISSVLIKDKAGTFVGARMGRPEKAKMRQMTGSPQAMFPVGEEGDRLRSVQAALKAGKVHGVFPLLYCSACQKSMVYGRCEECGQKCIQKYFCRLCGDLDKESCRHGKGTPYKMQDIDISYYFTKAMERLHENVYPDLIKGIRGTSNKEHIVEHLAKGILRAKHGIYVNKEGTTRYDCTELPITHFKPKEIGTPIEKLKEMGYFLDIHGQELADTNQVLELKPQDLILPGFGSLEESAPKVLTRVANFIDNLLVNFYGLEPYYNISKEEDLVGQLVIGLAPHISAGLVGRIIGFSETQGLFTHPMYHAGLRRDCVHPSTKFIYINPRQEFPLQAEEIGPLVERLISQGARTKTIDAVGTIKVELNTPLFAYGVDPHTKKFKKKEIRYFIKGPNPEKWIKITTATNRNYIMTLTHDFLHISESKFCFKKAKDIVVGDKLPLLQHFSLTLPEKKQINILDLLLEHVPDPFLSNLVIELPLFFKQIVHRIGRGTVLKIIHKKSRNLNEWYQRTPLSDVKKLLVAKAIVMEDLLKHKATIRVKFSDRRYNLSLPITNNLVSLLGYYAAEGYSRKNKWVSQVCFRIGNVDIRKAIVKASEEVFGITPSLGEEATKITIGDQLIYLLFRYCFTAGSNAYDKRVPSLLYSLSDQLVATYLSAFIDGDGSVVSQRNCVVLYSVNRSLLDDFGLLLTRFGIVARYQTTAARFPGKTVLAIYARLQKEPVSHILHHLVITGKDIKILQNILRLNEAKKQEKLMKLRLITTVPRTTFNHQHHNLESIGDIVVDYVKKIELVEDNSPSYCVEVEWNTKEERNVLWGEQIINTRCDGDEAAVMLLMDALLNFSRKFLPNTRGSTMDAALVLTSYLNPTEIDDQVHGMDTVWKYPLEFYDAAMQMKNPWDVKHGEKQEKIEQLNNRLGTPAQYEGWGYTHPVDNINHGVQCSAYKTAPTMADKLLGQMEIARKVRAVDMDDVAKLVIQKHFLKDIKGNLKKFSMQQFRCVKCSEKFRRPPLCGKCTKCSGKIIFTITEGSVVKYLGPSLMLCEKYNFSPYLKQTLDILKQNVDNVFGKEKEKQVGLGAFGM